MILHILYSFCFFQMVMVHSVAARVDWQGLLKNSPGRQARWCYHGMREPSGWSCGWSHPCDGWVQPKFRYWTGFTKDPVLWLCRSTFPSMHVFRSEKRDLGYGMGLRCPLVTSSAENYYSKCVTVGWRIAKGPWLSYPLSSVCQFSPSTGFGTALRSPARKDEPTRSHLGWGSVGNVAN